MMKRIRKSLREKIIEFDDWAVGLVGDGNFWSAGGEEEGFGGVVVGMGGEDGEELGRSFSAGAGDEDCHVFLFLFIFYFFIFLFCISWGRERLGFGLRRDVCVFFGGRHGRKVSQTSKQSDRMIQVRCDVMR